MTSEQVIAVQRKFYAMAGMNGELCQEGVERLLSGFDRYGYESHRECTDQEWRQEVREEIHDAFVMLTGLEQSRGKGGAAQVRALQDGDGPPKRQGGDPLGMVVGVVLKHLESGFSATFVEEMVRTLGELATQDGREMMELSFRLGEMRSGANMSVAPGPREIADGVPAPKAIAD